MVLRNHSFKICKHPSAVFYLLLRTVKQVLRNETWNHDWQKTDRPNKWQTDNGCKGSWGSVASNNRIEAENCFLNIAFFSMLWIRKKFFPEIAEEFSTILSDKQLGEAAGWRYIKRWQCWWHICDNVFFWTQFVNWIIHHIMWSVTEKTNDELMQYWHLANSNKRVPIDRSVEV